MSELFDKMSGGQALGLFAILVGGIYLMVEAVTKSWSRVRRVEAETTLKREMLAAGKSVEEIERVTRATTDRK